MEKSKIFHVKWLKPALQDLWALYNVDHDAVYDKSIHLLGNDPFGNSEKTADYPDYKYNGSELALIRSVIVVYQVDVKKMKVKVVTCLYAGTGEVAQILYNIKPPFINY